MYFEAKKRVLISNTTSSLSSLLIVIVVAICAERSESIGAFETINRSAKAFVDNMTNCCDCKQDDSQLRSSSSSSSSITVDDYMPNLQMDAIDSDSNEIKFDLAKTLEKFDYAILMFYPSDFTFVCPTEVRSLNSKLEEFHDEYKCELITVSTDSIHAHKAWKVLPKQNGGLGVPIDLIMASDRSLKVSRMLNVLDEKQGISRRAIFIVNKERKVIFTLQSADNIGRNVDELIRIMAAVKKIAENPGDVCTANFKVGGPSAKKTFESVSKDI